MSYKVYQVAFTFSFHAHFIFDGGDGSKHEKYPKLRYENSEMIGRWPIIPPIKDQTKLFREEIGQHQLDFKTQAIKVFHQCAPTDRPPARILTDHFFLNVGEAEILWHNQLAPFEDVVNLLVDVDKIMNVCNNNCSPDKR